jgi:hypothetical protein
MTREKKTSLIDFYFALLFLLMDIIDIRPSCTHPIMMMFKKLNRKVTYIHTMAATVRSRTSPFTHIQTIINLSQYV